MTTGTTPIDSELVVVDSSGWLEFATDDSRAKDFAPYIDGKNTVLIPVIVLYEVYRKLRMMDDTTAADRFASLALRKTVVALDENLALAAAGLSLKHHLHMADAMIYATAQAYDAQLITSDAHFRDLPGVTLL